ncbi:MAG: hypothetical protein ACJ74Y_01135 [Bryobacteraceae bacterium]
MSSVEILGWSAGLTIWAVIGHWLYFTFGSGRYWEQRREELNGEQVTQMLLQLRATLEAELAASKQAGTEDMVRLGDYQGLSASDHTSRQKPKRALAQSRTS